MLHLAQLNPTPTPDALETAIQDRLADLDSGKYRSNNEFVLDSSLSGCGKDMM